MIFKTALNRPFTVSSFCRKGEFEFPYTIPEKDLHSFGGYTAIIDRVADLVRYLQDPVIYEARGISAPKGVILSGPPGVGKSALAEAIAGHAGVPFIIVSGAELLDSFVGNTEKKIRDLFKQGESLSPCVLCLDEIETLAANRSSRDKNSNHTYYINSTVNQMLTTLAKNRPGLITVGTTNDFDQLDKAIVRPGRFDRHIALSLPTCRERVEILKIHARNKALCPSLSLKDIASLCSGFSGAHLAALINEASIVALREQSPLITPQHIDTGLMLLKEGVSSEPYANPETKFMVASHEAGHAVIGHHLGKKVYKVTILKSALGSAAVHYITPDQEVRHTKQNMKDEICGLLGGRAAELLLSKPMIGSASDIENAKKIALMMVAEGMGSSLVGSDADVSKVLKEEMQRAETLLRQYRPTWERLRDTLIERNFLLRDDFLKVVSGEKLKGSKNATAVQLPLPATRAARIINPNMALTEEQMSKALGGIEILSMGSRQGGTVKEHAYSIKFKKDDSKWIAAIVKLKIDGFDDFSTNMEENVMTMSPQQGAKFHQYLLKKGKWGDPIE